MEAWITVYQQIKHIKKKHQKDKTVKTYLKEMQRPNRHITHDKNQNLWQLK